MGIGADWLPYCWEPYAFLGKLFMSHILGSRGSF